MPSAERSIDDVSGNLEASGPSSPLHQRTALEQQRPLRKSDPVGIALGECKAEHTSSPSVIPGQAAGESAASSSPAAPATFQEVTVGSADGKVAPAEMAAALTDSVRAASFTADPVALAMEAGAQEQPGADVSALRECEGDEDPACVHATSVEAEVPLNAASGEAEEVVVAALLEAERPVHTTSVQAEAPVDTACVEAERPVHAASLCGMATPAEAPGHACGVGGSSREGAEAEREAAADASHIEVSIADAVSPGAAPARLLQEAWPATQKAVSPQDYPDHCHDVERSPRRHEANGNEVADEPGSRGDRVTEDAQICPDMQDPLSAGPPGAVKGDQQGQESGWIEGWSDKDSDAASAGGSEKQIALPQQAPPSASDVAKDDVEAAKPECMAQINLQADDDWGEPWSDGHSQRAASPQAKIQRPTKTEQSEASDVVATLGPAEAAEGAALDLATPDNNEAVPQQDWPSAASPETSLSGALLGPEDRKLKASVSGSQMALHLTLSREAASSAASKGTAVQAREDVSDAAEHVGKSTETGDEKVSASAGDGWDDVWSEGSSPKTVPREGLPPSDTSPILASHSSESKAIDLPKSKGGARGLDGQKVEPCMGDDKDGGSAMHRGVQAQSTAGANAAADAWGEGWDTGSGAEEPVPRSPDATRLEVTPQKGSSRDGVPQPGGPEHAAAAAEAWVDDWDDDAEDVDEQVSRKDVPLGTSAVSGREKRQAASEADRLPHLGSPGQAGAGADAWAKRWDLEQDNGAPTSREGIPSGTAAVSGRERWRTDPLASDADCFPKTEGPGQVGARADAWADDWDDDGDGEKQPSCGGLPLGTSSLLEREQGPGDPVASRAATVQPEESVFEKEARQLMRLAQKAAAQYSLVSDGFAPVAAVARSALRPGAPAPALTHAKGTVKSLLAHGLGAFGFKTEVRKLADYDNVVILVLGGISVAEVVQVSQVVRECSAAARALGAPVPTVLVGGTSVATAKSTLASMSMSLGCEG